MQMTNPNENPTVWGRDRPDSQEVEITPEMVAAGLSAYEWHAESVDPEYLIKKVYTAMAAVSPRAAWPPGHRWS